MKKVGYCSLTYLYQFFPKELGLSDDCSEREFEDAIEHEVDRIKFRTEDIIGEPNDIEITIL